jgi:spore coat protein U-like protein
MKRILFIAAAAIVASVPAVCSASATTNTSTGILAVSATVVNSCSVGSSAMAFGNVQGLTVSVPLNATGNVSVTCTNSAAYNVGLDKGLNGGSVTTRLMSDGSGDTISYTLYRDPTRTQNWGQTVGTDTVAGTGSGAAQSLSVYGTIPSQNLHIVDPYADTVTVTVTY